MGNYRLPNKKKWLLTDEFLTTFKEELDIVFKIKPEENPTYWNTYMWLDSTSGFYAALKKTSEKYNVKKAIYEYACKLPWYDSDFFDSELTEMMYKRGIIEEGSPDEINNDYTEEHLKKMEREGKIEWVEETKYYNGYHVTKREWRYL